MAFSAIQHHRKHSRALAKQDCDGDWRGSHTRLRASRVVPAKGALGSMMLLAKLHICAFYRKLASISFLSAWLRCSVSLFSPCAHELFILSQAASLLGTLATSTVGKGACEFMSSMVWSQYCRRLCWWILVMGLALHVCLFVNFSSRWMVPK